MSERGGPIAHCAVALVVADGKVLLGLRSPFETTYPGVWDMFGGHAEDGETTEDALVRELGEELDITPTRFEFFASFDEPDAARNGRSQYHFFKVTAWSGRGPRLRGPEHTEIRWCTLGEALALDLAIDDYRALFEAHVV